MSRLDTGRHHQGMKSQRSVHSQGSLAWAKTAMWATTWETGTLPRTSVDIRGRVEPMTVRTAERAAMLSDIVAAGASPAATMAATTA